MGSRVMAFGIAGFAAACWCGETGKRGDPTNHWAQALAGSSPATSTLVLLLTRRLFSPMFIGVGSPRSQFRYVRKPGSESSPAFLSSPPGPLSVPERGNGS